MRIWLLLVLVFVIFGGNTVLASPNENVCEISVWAYFPEAISCAGYETWTTQESYDCNCTYTAVHACVHPDTGGLIYTMNPGGRPNCWIYKWIKKCDTCTREIEHARCNLWLCCTVQHSTTGVPFYSNCYHSRTQHGCHDSNQ